MKKLLLTLAAIPLTFLIFAQDVTKVKEAGLTFYNFDTFGATFRIGNANSLWRYSAFASSGSDTHTTNAYSNPDVEVNSSSFRASVTFGHEFRKTIKEKFQFRYGADIGLGYFHAMSETIDTDTDEFSKQVQNGMSYQFNLVVGGNYALSENFVLGLELLPYVQYSGSKIERKSPSLDTTSDNSTFYYGISSSSVLLSLVYRW